MYLLFFCFAFSIYDYYFSFSELFQVRTCELAYSYAPVVVGFFWTKKSCRREIFFMEDPPIESTWNRKRSFDDAINASLPGCRFCLVTQRSSLFGEVRCVTRRKRLRGRQGRHLIDFRSKRGTFFTKFSQNTFLLQIR